jgi:alpha-mannosidase
VGRIEASFPLPLPAALAKDRLRRERRAIACPVRVRITLRHESPVVEIETSFDNRAQDHRLRAIFPAAIETDEVQSDGQFFVNNRPIDEPRGLDWAQSPTGTFPQQEFSLIEDAQGGLAVLNRGLPEIAPRRDARGRVGLALTLLRAVGWLSRDDLEARRRQNAGPTLATPEAQCPGPHRFRYAVLPFATIAGAAASGPGAGRRASAAACAKQWSQRYRVPPLVVQGVEDQHVPGGRGLLHKASPATAVSAIKKHESRDGTEGPRAALLRPRAARRLADRPSRGTEGAARPGGRPRPADLPWLARDRHDRGRIRGLRARLVAGFQDRG